MQTKQKMGGWGKLALLLVIPALIILASSTDGKAAVAEDEVCLPKTQFVDLMTNVKVLKERLKNLEQRDPLYKQLDADQKELIKRHLERIKVLEASLDSSEKLAEEFKATMEKIEPVLDEYEKELKREKRLSRYKTEGYILSVLAAWLLF